MAAPRPDPGVPEIVVLADATAVSHAAAERIADALAGAIAARGVAHWATTGGSTPGPIYEALVRPPLRDRVDWGRVSLWWGDERFVPRSDPASNVRLVDRVLLGDGGVAIPPERVHPVPVDAVLASAGGPAIAAGAGGPAESASGPAESASGPAEAGAGLPAEAAARYAAELHAEVPFDGGQPVFDLVIVGVGPDGHVLSVFPGSEAFGSAEPVMPIPAPTHVEPHLARVTLNPAMLDRARTLIAVVHGAAKAGIVGTLLGPERDERRWPAQRARRAGATWLLDAAAAADLGR